MATLESGPETPQINNQMWYEGVRDSAVARFNEARSEYHENPERGGIALSSLNEIRKFYPTMIAAGAATLALGGLGLAHNFFGSIKTETTLTAGEGALKSTFALDKECYGGYVNEVKGAKAEINKKIFGIGTTFKASETFNGDVTSEICNTGIDGEMVVDKKTHQTTVTIPATAFETTVYQTNPSDAKAWTSDNGAAVAIMKNFGNAVKVLPGGVDVKGGDELSSKLRGWALLSAYELSSKGCGTTAWPHIKDAYAAKIKDKVVANNNTFSDIQITPQEVTVNLPDSVAFKNQYESQFADLQSKLTKTDVKFNKVDPNSFVCRDMPAGSGGAK